MQFHASGSAGRSRFRLLWARTARSYHRQKRRDSSRSTGWCVRQPAVFALHLKILTLLHLQYILPVVLIMLLTGGEEEGAPAAK